jgi:hypothetical protein
MAVCAPNCAESECADRPEEFRWAQLLGDDDESAREAKGVSSLSC